MSKKIISFIKNVFPDLLVGSGVWCLIKGAWLFNVCAGYFIAGILFIGTAWLFFRGGDKD